MTTIPPVVLFALLFFAADVATTTVEQKYFITVVLYMLAFLSVPLTSWLLRRAINKNMDGTDEERLAKIGPTYKIRIAILNVVSIVNSFCYLITLERGCIYLFAMMSMLILMSFPTNNYLLQKR